MSRASMPSVTFRREREASWRELESLLDRVDRGGMRALGTDEVVRLAELYRAVMSSLGVARAISLDRNLVAYLDALGARAYMTVYRTRRGPVAVCLDFVLRDFPREVRRLGGALALVAAILVGATLAGHALVVDDPSRFYAFVDPGLAADRGPHASTEALAAMLEPGEGTAIDRANFASALLARNAGIGLLSFPLGVLGGAPVLLLVAVNGLMLGAFTAVYAEAGLLVPFLGWVLPHGITEFLAVTLCAAAGLRVGRAALFPGPHRRRDQIVRAGRAGSVVVLGGVLGFGIAALLESFFRETADSLALELGTAALTAVVWTLYLGLVGRERR